MLNSKVSVIYRLSLLNERDGKQEVMDLEQLFNAHQSRRSMLRTLGALAGASLTLSACSGNQPVVTKPTLTANINTVIKHVVIACQENHTFDNYFGHYPKAGQFGIPANFTQPDGKGGTVTPYHFSSHKRPDIGHDWSSIHDEWNNAAMNGFVTTDGHEAIGYYDHSDLPYYYALADAFTESSVSSPLTIDIVMKRALSMLACCV